MEIEAANDPDRGAYSQRKAEAQRQAARRQWRATAKAEEAEEARRKAAEAEEARRKAAEASSASAKEAEARRKAKWWKRVALEEQMNRDETERKLRDAWVAEQKQQAQQAQLSNSISRIPQALWNNPYSSSQAIYNREEIAEEDKRAAERLRRVENELSGGKRRRTRRRRRNKKKKTKKTHHKKKRKSRRRRR